jgi:hypothetical protein
MLFTIASCLGYRVLLDVSHILTLPFGYRFNLKKLTYEQRKASLVERLNALNSSAGAADDDEDDDE